MEILDAALAGGAKVLPGDVAFKLHDTYGFPLDLTNDVCRERGLSVDEAGFQTAMEEQKNKARAAGKFKMDRALEYTGEDRKSTRLNSSHLVISYAVFCLKKKKKQIRRRQRRKMRSP